MKLFGTDGIRGKVNRGCMTPETMLRVGMAIGVVLHEKDGIGRQKVLIGKDTRISGYVLESALTSGICSMGVDVTLVGPIPTPGVAFLTRALRLDAGVVISASHNPYHDNGIKIFSYDGFKLSDEMESRIEQLALAKSCPVKRPSGSKIGKAFRLDDAAGRYIEYIKSSIPRGIDLVGMRVVIDSANGAAYKITPQLLKELGAEVISIHDEPDGININRDCGSLHLDSLAEEVRKHEAHIGIAHDGDADRTLFVDEKGHIVDGDLVMSIIALELKRERRLRHDTVVMTVMSNLGVERHLERHGVKGIRTKVGDRYVVEEMRKSGYNFGGEQSGHIVFFDYNTTGDGPITALQVLHLMRKRNVRLSELVKDIELYPQVLLNVPVPVKKDLKEFPAITKLISETVKTLGNRGRLLVRPSGTEPKIRVMVECENADLAKTSAERIAAAIENQLGEK
ncbi:MAG TPA: phosphoglucosamine mutase [Dissulfurispiraceae bacterium]|nr:phosphoglucosamine mutase [Dissulfurispiraceae bacterium]